MPNRRNKPFAPSRNESGAPPRRSRQTRPAPSEPERIQKVLAHAGLGSRREIETWISEGALRINGQVAKLGDRIRPTDRVTLNGRPINLEKRLETPTRVLIYHKPTGEVVSRRDPEGRPVIFTQLPRLTAGRWINVGRLDINTQGLLLVTTNGELANRLMHPSHQLEREYAVRVYGQVSDAVLQRLREGVELDDGRAHFESITDAGGEGANHWYRVVLREGRNRIVRRLWESQGVTVSRLIRVRFGPIELPPRLKACTYQELTAEELAGLMDLVELQERRTPPAGPRRRPYPQQRRAQRQRDD